MEMDQLVILKVEVNALEKSSFNNQWYVLAILSSIPVIMVLGNSMIIPVLPTIGAKFEVSSFQTSLLITLFSIPAAIVIPVAGILADRVGRKKTIFFSLILYGCGGLLSGLAAIWNSYSFMLISRMIQGIGAAGTAPITMVLVSDLYQEDQRSKSLGIIEAANAMGKVLSPILGSILAMIIWYAMFFAFPLLCVPIAICLWFFVNDSNRQKPPPLSEYLTHLKKIGQRQGKWMSTAFFAGFVTMFAMFGVLFYFSDYLENLLHKDGILKGLILAIPLLGLCLTSYLVGSYVKQKTNKMKWLIVTGLMVSCLMMAFVPWTERFLYLSALLLFIGVGCGFILPCLNTLITSAVGYQERGMITSLYSSVRFLGVALGPPSFGALNDRPIFLFLGVSILLLLTAFLASLLIRRPLRVRGKKDRSRLFMRRKRFSPT